MGAARKKVHTTAALAALSGRDQDGSEGAAAMATLQPHPLVRYVRALAAPSGTAGLTDAQLLERFADLGDEAAFAALVSRHGPLVLGACRRVLRHWHDAEDC